MIKTGCKLVRGGETFTYMGDHRVDGTGQTAIKVRNNFTLRAGMEDYLNNFKHSASCPCKISKVSSATKEIS